MLTTRDEAIRDLADRAEDQCRALGDKLTAILDGEDDDGEEDTEALRGITRDKTGRSALIFSEDGATNRRTWVYVDAILALAKLLNGEVQVTVDDD